MHKSAWPSLLRILAVSYAASCVSVGAVDVNSQLVEDLMAKMTLEEKVGQLELYSRPSGSDFNGQSIGWNTTVKLIRAGQVGASLRATWALKQEKMKMREGEAIAKRQGVQSLTLLYLCLAT